MDAIVVDDKSSHCIPFILTCLQEHRQIAETNNRRPAPFFVGLQGIQGAGKTTLVDTLSHTLSSPPHSLSCVVLSIDDLYLPHSEQVALAKSNPNNKLVQHRGQPSTHDIPLGLQVFAGLTERKTNIKLPSYDKSAFNGAGDRRPLEDWQVINTHDKPLVEVIIFEGWCVGFRALDDQALEQKWTQAKQTYDENPELYNGQLGRVSLESVKFVNERLRAYDALTDQYSCFVQLDAEDTQYVYGWRAQQEAALRRSKGTGMTEDQVREFVDGYYPAYELYSNVLRNGIFKTRGRQLRLVVDKARKVTAVHKL